MYYVPNHQLNLFIFKIYVLASECKNIYTIIDPVCIDMCSPDLYIDTFLQLGYNLGQCKDYGFDILMKSEVIEIGSDNITVNYYLKKTIK